MDPEERFRAKVVPDGDHDVWTGARDASGTGLVRINGVLRTVQRAAWEFAHGPMGEGERVLACPDNRSCVRIEHLRLSGHPPTPARQRGRRGSGSKRQIRPGVWRLTVSDGLGPGGKQRRRNLTVYGTELDATNALRALAETTHSPTRLGDLRVRELLDRYLDWLGADEAPAHMAPMRRLADEIIEPAVGRHYAALLDASQITGLLKAYQGDGATSPALQQLHQLIADAYGWARSRQWTELNPTEAVRAGDISP